jgi:hydrogenase maturation protein HypF
MVSYTLRLSMEIKNIKLPFRIRRDILALGSQTKNTVCFAKDNLAYLSPIHGDLSNFKDFLGFEKDVKFFLKKNPKIVAYDLHPEYQSSKYAQQLRTRNCELRTIQHHHAHISSCMLENGVTNQKVIGVALDGTGLGLDNTLWGGEFFICDYKNFTRKAHLREIPLLGGEKAISEPWRLTVIWLYQIYKDKFLDLKINFVKALDKNKWSVLKKIYLSEVHSPLASSMGRLFDAAASLVLEKYKASFEAELAIELEKIAAGFRSQALGLRQAASYKFRIIKTKDERVVDPVMMFKEIIKDLQKEMPRQKIAFRFHLTVAQMIKKVCLILRKENKINKVVLSGGVFQNKLLLQLSLDLLSREGFKIFTHQQLPSNDASISLGQIGVANFPAK